MARARARAGLLVAIAAAALASGPRTAGAQELLVAGTAAVHSGIESSGKGLLRARTRLRVGAELRIDESPKDGIAFGAIVDLEPRAAFGADLRYVRVVSERIALNAGAIGYAAPGTLLGAVAGAEVRVKIGSSASIIVAPEVTVFFLGTDLPDNNIFWQGLLGGGVRVQF
jgi:hypothetical protein